MEGLRTAEAMEMLCGCLETQLRTAEAVAEAELPRNARFRDWPRLQLLGRSLRHHDRHKFPGAYCWRSLALHLLILLLLLVSLGLEPGEAVLESRGICVAFLLLLLGGNLAVSVYSQWLRETEMRRKVEGVLRHCRALSREASRLECPGIYAPGSECIHTQWTRRDGEVVSLPWILLVKGDVVLLRPGREAPCLVQSAQGQTFIPTQLYLPKELAAADGSGMAPMEPLRCRVLETPLASFARTVLCAPPRPPSHFANEYYRGVHGLLETYVIPVVLAASLLIAALRCFLIPGSAGPFGLMTTLIPAMCLLPLAGMPIPLFLFGVVNWIRSGLLSTALGQPLMSKRRASLSPASPPPSEELGENKWDLMAALGLFAATLRGDPSRLSFSAPLLDTMANVTSVSVVDKKGVLSWPNATPEKAFFLRPAEDANAGLLPGFLRRDSVAPGKGPLIPEVLDITHTPDEVQALSFDNQNWGLWLNNLKPIGLNVLLNNCCLDEPYAKFLDHVHVISEWVPRTIAVVNRRCCCQLAAAMGFEGSRLGCEYRRAGTLAAYKKEPGQAPLPGLTKHRTPLPNVFAAVAEDRGPLQQAHVMAQGTADLLLDLCSHAWTGTEAVDLSRGVRKKIIDFYHRHSMTSYCLAFSYRPRSASELMPAAGSYVDWPLFEVTEAQPKAKLQASPRRLPPAPPRLLEKGASLSLGSLGIGEEVRDGDLSAAERLLSHHVFLGMVTLQYQTREDVVRLVERLDKACIRFVHFSKENELRSRVFAEKMGLEAGWNCHISLASVASVVAAASPPSRYRATSLSLLQTGAASTRRIRRESAKRRLSLPSSAAVYPRSRRGHSESVLDSLAGGRLDSENDTGRSTRINFAETVEPLLEDKEKEEEASKEDVFEFMDETEADDPLLDATVDDDDAAEEEKAEYISAFSNRAMLPKGIENVRPHLEHVDNVPLLVSLFTDCDHASTREMIAIMQEHGEVVLVMGSTLNYHNAGIFAQANAALGVEPLQPVNCVLDEVSSPNISVHSATKIATELEGLPTSLGLAAHQQISLLPLIAESRRRLRSLRCALVFLLSASLFLCLAFGVPLLLFLPPPFRLPQLLLWLLLILPLLALSVLATPVGGEEMIRTATPKADVALAPRALRTFVACFAAKFIPTALLSTAVFAGALSSLCQLKADCVNGTAALPCRREDEGCWWFLPANETGTRDWGEWYGAEKTELGLLAQHFVSALLSLYVCLMSGNFLFPFDHAWARLPLRNAFWVGAVVASLLAQAAFSLASVRLELIGAIPWPLALTGLLWVFPMLAFMELAKRREILNYRREQRRRRLAFGTKLGLNSPF